ncbi:hypothetical protein [Teredinibacter franksiae]|uniref:hypothetical protein n=1 Tax=Teredinibacter franksiae TaxID=2761453 RepID=UPI001FEAD4AF|nr:hypothetical protein [Teredinibacter franksiae]
MKQHPKSLRAFLCLASVLVAAVISNSSMACEEPAKPSDFPDPANAVSAQMVKAKNEVTAYVNAMQKYVSCSNYNTAKQRNVIKDLETYAESFNQVIREYKELKKS